ncbi:carbohydrate-binding family 9-like protein [Flavihumibacter fluvii]|uniref:carbohydrate-binding family 9-like protein n=1 Tax=Flavihumibacter fluvii TaxID=2838157 RepID=UPI001BDE5C26|nr:carbohydrate-binding family 9-like protein [Flavihumibacter fluvii]ULQ54581.1 carbohydrate-binding family 9-like protein [Flavihumibacter fluvii]
MKLYKKLLLFPVLVICCSLQVYAHGCTIDTIPCKEEEIPHYTAYKVKKAPVIDGRLDEEIWTTSIRSPQFKDLIYGTNTFLDTRAAVRWDNEYLYVAYWIDEPDLKATHTVRDALIYEDNDVELFVAGTDGYYEFEINALGTIYEVLFFWEDAFEKKGYSKKPEFNKNSTGAKPFNGVGYRHPRGQRIGFWNWDFPGLKKAVQVNGTINDGKDTDKGWTVELALPWKGFDILAKGDGRALPPKNNDTWRMDFSRFNTYKDKTGKDSGGWAWSPHGVWDSHVPECFTYIHFSTEHQAAGQ